MEEELNIPQGQPISKLGTGRLQNNIDPVTANRALPSTFTTVQSGSELFATSFNDAFVSFAAGAKQMLSGNDETAIRDIMKWQEESSLGLTEASKAYLNEDGMSGGKFAYGMGSAIGQAITTYVPATIAALTGNPLAVGAVAAIASFPSMYNSTLNSALESDLDINDAIAYAATTSIGLSALEMIPVAALGRRMAQPVLKGVIKDSIGGALSKSSLRSIDDIGLKLARDGVSDSVLLETYTAAKNGIIDRMIAGKGLQAIGSQMASEGLTEFTQSYMEKYSQKIYDDNFSRKLAEKGAGKFGTTTEDILSANQFQEALIEGMFGGIVGGIMSAPIAFKPIQSQGMYDVLSVSDGVGKLEQGYNSLKASIEEKAKPETKDELLGALDEVYTLYNQFKDGIPDKAVRSALFSGVQSRKKIQGEVETLEAQKLAIIEGIENGQLDSDVFKANLDVIDKRLENASNRLFATKDFLTEMTNNYFKERESGLENVGRKILDEMEMVYSSTQQGTTPPTNPMIKFESRMQELDMELKSTLGVKTPDEVYIDELDDGVAEMPSMVATLRIGKGKQRESFTIYNNNGQFVTPVDQVVQEADGSETTVTRYRVIPENSIMKNRILKNFETEESRMELAKKLADNPQVELSKKERDLLREFREDIYARVDDINSENSKQAVDAAKAEVSTVVVDAQETELVQKMSLLETLANQVTNAMSEEGITEQESEQLLQVAEEIAMQVAALNEQASQLGKDIPVVGDLNETQLNASIQVLGDISSLVDHFSSNRKNISRANQATMDRLRNLLNEQSEYDALMASIQKIGQLRKDFRASRKKTRPRVTEFLKDKDNELLSLEENSKQLQELALQDERDRIGTQGEVELVVAGAEEAVGTISNDGLSGQEAEGQQNQTDTPNVEESRTGVDQVGGIDNQPDNTSPDRTAQTGEDTNLDVEGLPDVDAPDYLELQAREFSEELDRKLDDILRNVFGSLYSDIQLIVSDEDIDIDNLSPSALFQLSNKVRKEFLDRLSKKRPELVENGTIDSVIDSIESFSETESNGDKKLEVKLQKLAFHWTMNGQVILPEDGYKILHALKISQQKGVDLMAYKSPDAVIEKYSEVKIKQKRIDPDTVPQFKNKRDIGMGVVVYDVDNTEEGRQAARAVIDTHFGEDANPWCLLARVDGDISDTSTYWFDNYPGEKKISFHNGKLASFYGGDKWWNRIDEPNDGVEITTTGDLLNDGTILKGTFIVPEVGTPSGFYETGVPFDDKNAPASGKWQKLSSDGVLLSEQNYSNNELNGYFRFSDDDGILRTEGNYKDGNLDGRVNGYDYEGNLEEVYSYVNGVLNGEFVTYYSNGNIRKEGFYKNDQLDGVEIRRYEDGNITSISNYENGYLSGTYKEFYPDGQIKHDVTYSNGEKQGVEEIYHSNGQLASESYFENGELIGEPKYYYDNGQIKSKYTTNSKGFLSVVKYLSNGKTLSEEFYANDASENPYVYLGIYSQYDSYGYLTDRYWQMEGRDINKNTFDYFKRKYDDGLDAKGNLLTQKKGGKVLGVADISARKIILDDINRTNDTLSHEYAHFYIRKFFDTPIVQKAMEKFGSEEDLVQAIGEQVVRQKGEAFDWWNKFSSWVKSIFQNLDSASREQLLAVLTEGFLTNQDLTNESFGTFKQIDSTDIKVGDMVGGLSDKDGIIYGTVEQILPNRQYKVATSKKGKGSVTQVVTSPKRVNPKKYTSIKNAAKGEIKDLKFNLIKSLTNISETLRDKLNSFDNVQDLMFYLARLEPNESIDNTITEAVEFLASQKAEKAKAKAAVDVEKEDGIIDLAKGTKIIVNSRMAKNLGQQFSDLIDIAGDNIEFTVKLTGVSNNAESLTMSFMPPSGDTLSVSIKYDDAVNSGLFGKKDKPKKVLNEAIGKLEKKQNNPTRFFVEGTIDNPTKVYRISSNGVISVADKMNSSGKALAFVSNSRLTTSAIERDGIIDLQEQGVSLGTITGKFKDNLTAQKKAGTFRYLPVSQNENLQKFISSAKVLFRGVSIGVVSEEDWMSNYPPEASAIFNKATGQVLLRDGYINEGTIIHELGHVFVEVMKQNLPTMYETAIQLVRGSVYVDKVKSLYPELTEDIDIHEEALGWAIEDAGNSILNRQFGSLFKRIFKRIGEFFGYKGNSFENITLKDFSETLADAIISGREIETIFGEELGTFTPSTGVAYRIFGERFTPKPIQRSRLVVPMTEFAQNRLDLKEIKGKTPSEILSIIANVYEKFFDDPNTAMLPGMSEIHAQYNLDKLMSYSRLYKMSQDIAATGKSDDAMFSALIGNQFKGGSFFDSYYDYHSKSSAYIYTDKDNGVGEVAYINGQSEAADIVDAISKRLNLGTKGRNMASKILYSGFMSNFYNTKTFAMLLGKSGGILSGIEDNKVRRNNTAANFLNKGEAEMRRIVSRLTELSLARGERAEPLVGAVSFNFFNNIGDTPSNVTMDVPIAMLANAYATMKSQLLSGAKRGFASPTEVATLLYDQTTKLQVPGDGGQIKYRGMDFVIDDQPVRMLLNPTQLAAMDALFTSGGRYEEDFNLIWDFYNNESMQESFKIINEVKANVDGEYLDDLSGTYYPIYGSGKGTVNTRSTVNSLYDDVSHLQNRDSLAIQIRGVEVISGMSSYLRTTSQFIRNAETYKSYINYENMVSKPLMNVADKEIASIVRNVVFPKMKQLRENMQRGTYGDGNMRETLDAMGMKYSLWNTLMGNYARGIFSFNAGTVLKQGLAYASAYGLGIISNEALNSVAPGVLRKSLTSYKGYIAPENGKVLGAFYGGSLLEFSSDQIIDEIRRDPLLADVAYRIGDTTANTEGIELGSFDEATRSLKAEAASDPVSAMRKVASFVSKKIDKYGLAPMRRSDQEVIVGFYLAAKNDVQMMISRGQLKDAKGNLVTDITSEEARKKIALLTTEVVYATNNMYMDNDKTFMQQIDNPLVKMVGLFTSQPQKILNLVVQSYFDAADKGFRDEVANNKLRSSISNSILLSSVMASAITGFWGILRNGFDDEEPEKYAENFVFDLSRNLLGFVPSIPTQVIEGVISATDNQAWTSDVGGIVVFETINQLISAVGDVNTMMDETASDFQRERAESDAIYKAITGLAKVIGAPYVFASHIAKGN